MPVGRLTALVAFGNNFTGDPLSQPIIEYKVLPNDLLFKPSFIASRA
jgi:hypothetical protein